MTEPPDRTGKDALEITCLASLPVLEYGRERKPAAKRLGVPVSMLDREVEAARGDRAATDGGQGRALNLPVPEPWLDPVDGVALLDALAVAVWRYVVLSEADAHSVALWVLAVHAFDAWRIFPRLLITAPEKGCGKTTLLDVLKPLVPRPLAASNIKAAPLFRVIELARPTLLLDEADAYARDDEDLRSVLDAGHHREGAVIRCVGDEHEPRQFSAWAPVALAAIGHLPGTLEDRAIIIRLRRRRPDEVVESLRLDRADGLEKLARMAARWGRDHAAALVEADPSMPAGIVNRTADNWRPLVAIADLAGGVWPEHARRAAVELTAGTDDQGSIRVALLADIRAAFTTKAVDRMASEDLVGYLVSLDDRPWPEYRGGKAITNLTWPIGGGVSDFGSSK
jgi:putative DNA primase/helicase